MSTQEYDDLWSSIIDESREQAYDVDCFNQQRGKIDAFLYGGVHA